MSILTAFIKEEMPTWPRYAAAILLALMALWSCEKYKDPFSANNSSPGILVFEFKPDLDLPDASLRADGDSLKYKPGQAYAVALSYRDAESQSQDRNLRASFRFVAGSGRVSSNEFSNPSGDGLTFDVPAQFDDEIFVLPNRAGVVDLQLELSDGVKYSEVRTASTTFFENLKPVVRFQATTGSEQNPPYRVSYNAANSLDRDGSIENYTWSFGDNSSRVILGIGASSTSHDYLQSGSFVVRLIVKDDEGALDSLDQVVTTVNQPPIAALNVTPTSGKTPLTITYNALGSRDRDGDIVAYDVTFGDGMSSQEPSGSHTYTHESPPNNPFAVQLTVRDNVGATGTQSRPVTVVTLEANFVWQDCDLGNVTFISTSSGQIDGYEWDFGDGDRQSGANLSTVRKEYARSSGEGAYPVRLRISNGQVTTEVVKQVKIPCTP
ncbi:MAG: PKD domain-containing protein [bacterium]